MKAFLLFVYWIQFLLLIFCVHATPSLQANVPDYSKHYQTVPKYYIDPKILELSIKRYERCGLFNSSSSNSNPIFAMNELRTLYKTSASEYFRGHELIAYHYFVEYEGNPHRVHQLLDAEMEYLPILSLFWRSKDSGCDYKSFIQYLLEVHKILKTRDAELQAAQPAIKLPIRFLVASTFNMRTEWGFGMPSLVRKGPIYESISEFIMSLSIGHYERWPECPDLLRKWWKYVVELPYLDLDQSTFDQIDLLGSKDTAAVPLISSNRMNKKYNFFFAGDFELPGPERVCSVRNLMLHLASRPDTLLVNVTKADSHQHGVKEEMKQLMAQSHFCLVTPGQSYSTSFFYHAIQHGCIPIVISDWFTFSFPWKIPYELFVIRLNEADFVINPNAVMDEVLELYGLKGSQSSSLKLLDLMKMEMGKAKEILSFKSGLLSSTGSASPMKVIPALDLLLQELRYAQSPHNYYNNVPCSRPYMCKPLPITTPIAARNFSNLQTDYRFVDNKTKKIQLLSELFLAKYPENQGVYNKIFADESFEDVVLHNDGFQASALQIAPEKLKVDIRTHLCKHSKRLIGMYKMVYYMQCVRVLWPLQPGKFRNADLSERFDAAGYDEQKDKNQRGISKYDKEFVLAFHNISHTHLVGGNWANVKMYPIYENVMTNVKSMQDALLN